MRSKRSLQNAADVSSLMARMTAAEAKIVSDGLADLRAAMNDDLRSIQLVLIGDSNTWGLSATGIAATEPRGHSLADVRNNLTSPTWANLLRKWLGYKICSSNGLTQPQPGSGRYVDPVMVDPTRHAACGVYTTATGERVTSPAITDPRAGPKLGKSLDILGGQELRFSMTGDKFAIWFARMSTDAGATFDVIVDGTTVAAGVSHYNSPAVFGASHLVTLGAFGRHDVRIVNRSTAQFLRLEAIEHYRSVEVINQGLIGTTSTEWLPSGSLLSGAVPVGTTHAMIMLGTNDRAGATAPTQPTKVADNVQAIVEWLVANRAGLQPIVYSPPVAQGASEQGGGGATTYHFTASEAGRALGAMCQRKGYAFVDLNAHISYETMGGGVMLVGDDLHLSDAGHKARFAMDARLLTRA